METNDENSQIIDPLEYDEQHDREQYARVFGKRAATNKENGKKSLSFFYRPYFK